MKSYKSLLLLFVLFITLILSSVSTTEGCSRGSSFKMSELFNADFIVRATAVKYITTPDLKTTTSGVPNSTIEFKVEETIWGVNIPRTITLNGYLSQEDDFNDVPLPYRFVRRNGRHGSCFANTYKEGGQFLLFVSKNLTYATPDEYTTNISALGPSNEQLHGIDDPWIKWVKAYISPCAKQDKASINFAEISKDKMNAASKRQTNDLDKYRLAKCYLAKYGVDGNEARNYIQAVNNYEASPERR